MKNLAHLGIINWMHNNLKNTVDNKWPSLTCKIPDWQTSFGFNEMHIRVTSLEQHSLANF